MKRIMFVDDEPEMLSSLKRSLRHQKLPWIVEYARSGKEALQLLENRALDVIVTDLHMPEMDGEELLKIVSEYYPGMVQIILSGLRIENENSTHRFKRQILQKPCPIPELVKTIERGLFLKDIFQFNFLSQLRECFKDYSTFPDLAIRINSEKQTGADRAKAAAEIQCDELGLSLRLPLNTTIPVGEPVNFLA